MRSIAADTAALRMTAVEALPIYVAQKDGIAWRGDAVKTLRGVLLHVVQKFLTRMKPRFLVDALNVRMRGSLRNEKLFRHALLREPECVKRHDFYLTV